MGQSSISMLNKVGYSMFWSSMWDSKNLYSRNLKEDIFLNIFFDLIFNDNVSANIVRGKKFEKKRLNYYNLDIDEKNNTLYKYLVNVNRIKLTHSKIWILKYQKWIILYKFIYINEFEKSKSKISKCLYGEDFFYSFKFYNKAVDKINFNYNLFKKFVKSNIF